MCIRDRYEGKLSNEEYFVKYFLLTRQFENDASRVYQYASLKSDLNKKDVENAANLNRCRMVLYTLSEVVSYAEPEIISIGEKKAMEFVDRNPEIEEFRFSLEKLFRGAKHVLDASSEKLLSLYAPITSSAAELYSALAVGAVSYTHLDVYKRQPVYSAEGITNLKTWINTSEDNAKWYATNVLDGKAKVSDAQFKDVTFDYYGKTTGFTKSATNYWPAGSVGLGWKKNMEELANTLVGSKMNFDETKIVLDENSKTWKFDQIQSKATLVDAKDYYQVAKRAYNAATKK